MVSISFLPGAAAYTKQAAMAAPSASTASLPRPSTAEAPGPTSLPTASHPHWHVADYDWDPYTMTATRLVSSSCELLSQSCQ